MSKTLFWFRRDLRFEDHQALACALAESEGGVQPLFIFDTEILQRLEDRDDPRVTFLYNLVQTLKAQVEEQGGAFWIFHGSPEKIWQQLAACVSFDIVMATEDYEPYARRRDKKIALLLREQGKEFRVIKDQVIFHKADVLTDQKKPYTVYTPYKKKWLSLLREEHLRESKLQLSPKCWRPAEQSDKGLPPQVKEFAQLGFQLRTPFHFPDSVVQAQTIKKYSAQRDFPAIDEGTTRLGMHLRFGTVSPRQLLRAWRSQSAVWESELIWREFFMQILFHFPESETQSFRAQYDQIEWRDDERDFARWCAGETGYPMVDAGMRELNATGHMHNRVRMVVASFLCKHLLHYWRRGERYFARKLLDFDLSANVGNWQWAAGSGCDAAPYFRVFNPETQFEKFDPTQAYVKKWVPEWGTARYPVPMVEHTFARNRALTEYKKGLDKSIAGKQGVKE